VPPIEKLLPRRFLGVPILLMLILAFDVILHEWVGPAIGTKLSRSWADPTVVLFLTGVASAWLGSVVIADRYARYRLRRRMLAADHRCLKCKYDLRGLVNEIQCPECGSRYTGVYFLDAK